MNKEQAKNILKPYQNVIMQHVYDGSFGIEPMNAVHWILSQLDSGMNQTHYHFDAYKNLAIWRLWRTFADE